MTKDILVYELPEERALATSEEYWNVGKNILTSVEAATGRGRLPGNLSLSQINRIIEIDAKAAGLEPEGFAGVSEQLERRSIKFKAQQR